MGEQVLLSACTHRFGRLGEEGLAKMSTLGGLTITGLSAAEAEGQKGKECWTTYSYFSVSFFFFSHSLTFPLRIFSRKKQRCQTCTRF